MIGRVLFQFGGSDAVATLGDDGVWSVVVEGPGNAKINQVLTEDLNVNHSLREYGPADGEPGYLQLYNVAKETGGVVDAPPIPPTDPGLLY